MMGIFSSSSRVEEAAADEAFDKVDARLEALSLAGKRPVSKRPSLFANPRNQPTRQEA